MKLTKIVLLLSFFLCVEVKAQKAIGSSSQNKTVINGFAHGFKDSTLLYINEITDMGRGPTRKAGVAMIIGERFQFKDEKPSTEKLKRYFIHNNTASDYVYFWVDDQPITFSGMKGQFRNSLINGSSTQQMNEVYNRTVLPFYDKRDSLERTKGDQNSMDRLLAELKSKEISFIEKNPSSLISAYVLSGNCKNWGLKTTKELYQKLMPEIRESAFGRDVKKYIDLNKEIGVGSLFADFEQPTNDGKTARLSSLKSKYVLLEFWASNCGPCRRENPEMVKLYQNYKSRGFEIFGVSLDTSEPQWKKAIKDDKLPWLQVSDLKGYRSEAVLIYGVYEMPTNFLIDQSGKIIAKNLRGEELHRKIRALLGD